ncbi:RNA-directed DNA polymerase from mobile element jockey [Trichonephila clavipes]|nr:RNA-directed DNA polymerase from mobile element jockey [Trichonephila clavipes]
MIPKPGKDQKFPLNFRPISLISSIGKIYEKILLKRIEKYTLDNSIIPEIQHGFRKETSTCHQLLRATNIIISGFNNHATTGGIFLDVEKAFDRLWHNGLIFKMINLNYPPYLVHKISDYLHNRTFQVKIQATISKIGHIQAGSPQGSLLSPILYNIYTYDFPTSPLVDICLFADDAAILSQQDTPQKKPRPHPNSTEQSTAPHLKRPHLHQTDPYPQRPKNPSPHIQNKKNWPLHSTNKLTPTPTASSISKLPWTLRELTTCLSKQLT